MMYFQLQQEHHGHIVHMCKQMGQREQFDLINWSLLCKAFKICKHGFLFNFSVT